jgi:large subunit ribosomal protein L10
MNLDKKIIVGELLDRVNASSFVMVVDYVGLTVPQFTEFRDRLHEVGSECHVAKNSMMRRALSDAGLPDIAEHLTGQTAFLTGESDFAAAAKVVKNFEKEFKLPAIRVAILDNAVLDQAQVKQIADLPSREVLLGMLLGTINAPATKLLRTVKEPGASLARVIQAKFNSEG